ncbi:MAG TPA: hypothetical protein VMV18_02370, partial [bacterium]|nr:hypothetical protein [bacterium]
PSGVTASFSPATITAGSTSTLTLSASSSAAATTKSVTVKAAGNSTSHTATETLTVGSGNPTPSPDIANGDFEGSLSGWTLGGVKKPIDSSAQAHGGSKSMRAGSTSTTEPNGDSWAYQTVAIPSTATSATLTFWYYPWTTDTVAHDWQEMQIRDASGQTLKSVFKVASNDRAWTQKTVDLSAWKGKTVQIYFNVHSDGGSTPTSMWIDDVSLAVQ